MFFVQTIGLWRLRRKIRRDEDDLRFLRGFQPGDQWHASAQEMIPLVEAELKALRDELRRREGHPVSSEQPGERAGASASS
jgi:hypothetical protein